MPEPHFENVLPEPLLGIFRRLKGRLERRRNMEELVELAEAITGYAQMSRSREAWVKQPPQYIIVGIRELAFRFSENSANHQGCALSVEP
jgi:hypothetical protein